MAPGAKEPDYRVGCLWGRAAEMLCKVVTKAVFRF